MGGREKGPVGTSVAHGPCDGIEKVGGCFHVPLTVPTVKEGVPPLLERPV